MISAGERRLAAASFVVAATLACPFFRDNENRTLDLLRALAHGRLTIDRDAGNTVDRAIVESPPSAAAVELAQVAPASVLRGAHFYSGGAPGTAFLLLPAFVASSWLPERARDLLLVLVGGALPLALAAVAVRRAIERATGAPEESTLRAAAVFALGTIALPFATRLYAHALVVAFLAGALALLLRPRAEAAKTGEIPAGEARAALGAGLLAGLAVACDYSAALPASALGFLALLRLGRNAGLAFALGTAPPGLVLAAYHWSCFGSPFETAYSHHADASVRALVAGGTLGFGFPRPSVLYELLLGTRRGSLATQPAALLGAVGLVSELRRKRPSSEKQALTFALATAVAVTLLHAGRVRDWPGGMSFGPRYSIAALPFLALGLPRGFELLGWPRRALGTVLGYGLVLASVALAVAGAATDWGYSVAGTLEQLVRLGPRPRGPVALLTDVSLDGATSGAVLLASLTLAGALAFAATLLARDARAREIGIAFGAGLPLLASLPFIFTTHGNPNAVRRAQILLLVHEDERAVRDAADVETARRILFVARLHFAQQHDLEFAPIVLQALEKLCELAPFDEAARADRDQLRAQLQKYGPR